MLNLSRKLATSRNACNLNNLDLQTRTKHRNLEEFSDGSLHHPSPKEPPPFFYISLSIAFFLHFFAHSRIHQNPTASPRLLSIIHHGRMFPRERPLRALAL